MKIKTVEPSWAPNVPAQLRAALAAWFGLHARDLPWRRTRDPYSIMVSEFMLQQTQVITVIDFFQYPDVAVDATNVTMTFAVAPTAAQYRVVAFG